MNKNRYEFFDGESRETMSASSMDDAMVLCKEWVRAGDYTPANGIETVLARVWLLDDNKEQVGDCEHVSVTVGSNPE